MVEGGGTGAVGIEVETGSVLGLLPEDMGTGDEQNQGVTHTGVVEYLEGVAGRCVRREGKYPRRREHGSQNRQVVCLVVLSSRHHTGRVRLGSRLFTSCTPTEPLSGSASPRPCDLPERRL